MPMSDEAPVTSTQSWLMQPHSNPRLRYSLRFLVADLGGDLHLSDRVAQKRDCPGHKESIACIDRAGEMDIESVQQCQSSRQVHTDERGVEGGREHAVRDALAVTARHRECGIAMKRADIPGQASKGIDEVIGHFHLELLLDADMKVRPAVFVQSRSFPSSRSTMSPTFLRACTSPSENRTRRSFSMAVIRLIWASESQSATFAGLDSRVSSNDESSSTSRKIGWSRCRISDMVQPLDVPVARSIATPQVELPLAH